MCRQAQAILTCSGDLPPPTLSILSKGCRDGRARYVYSTPGRGGRPGRRFGYRGAICAMQHRRHGRYRWGKTRGDGTVLPVERVSFSCWGGFSKALFPAAATYVYICRVDQAIRGGCRAFWNVGRVRLMLAGACLWSTSELFWWLGGESIRFLFPAV